MTPIPDLAAAVEVVEGAESLALGCHVGPDGDALGSMLGLAAAARRRGKAVWASFGEPYSVPEAYRFLPVDLLVPPAEVPAQPEVMVTFDAGSIDRLGDLAEPAAAARTLIVIDHHVTNPGFGHINLVAPEAAATAEVVFHLLEALGWPIDQTVATCLHTGLVTDTGRFQYSNTTPETLRIASRLVEAGAEPAAIGRHVYEEVPFGYLQVAAKVLAQTELDRERRLVWSVLRAQDLAEAGIGLEETDQLIDAIRVAREADVAMLVKELEPERSKVSLRSRGRVDVGAIALELGGGGHHNAAGFTVPLAADRAVEEVRSRLELLDRDER